MRNKRTGKTHRVGRETLRAGRERERAFFRGALGTIEQLEPRRLLSTTWYVDAAASGTSHDGTSWTSAYTDLQQAIASAVAGDAIHVAQGTYKPTTTTDRTISFQLKSGVEIDGGYAGSTSSTPDVRDIVNYPTILSGDIGTKGDNTNNSYHVVNGSGVDAASAMNGVTITGGNANGNASRAYFGGGMINVAGSPTLVNCTFAGNAAISGAGIYNLSSLPSLSGCIFNGNAATGYDNNGRGGGIYNDHSSPSLTDCVFSRNSARNSGAGIFDGTSSPTLIHCTFTENSAVSGGGIINFDSTTILNDCTFSGNSVTANGGGICNYDPSSLMLTRCTFSDNTAPAGAALYNGVYLTYDSDTSSILKNCLFSWNRASDRGGGLYNASPGMDMVNCVFIGNTATSAGGGIFIVGSSPVLRACSFLSNSAGNGGGAYDFDSSNPIFASCIFNGNAATYNGGGLVNSWCNPTLIDCTMTKNVADFGGAMDNGNSSPILNNCIVWGDIGTVGVPEINNSSSTPVITYSDIQGGYAGTGNIDADPLFYRNPSAGADGSWGTADDDYGDLHLQPGSPCIDAGSNAAVPSDVTTDLDGNPRILDFSGVNDPGAIVDMGAYEAVDLDGMHLMAGEHLVLPAGHHVFSASGLIIDSGATLDIKDNSLIINYPGASSRLGSWDSSTGQYDGWTGQIQSGAIFSSLAQPRQTMLGIAAASNLFGISGSQTATWGGQTVGSIDVLIKFTYVGDANLDGKVNIDDYGRIDANVGQSGSVFGWYAGDFNFDGKINIDDYGLIDSIIGAQGPVL
jgi:hypothetical protein